MNTRANVAEYDEEMSAIISPRQERKKTRRVKQAVGVEKPPFKQKFTEERVNTTPLKPMNDLQAKYIEMIRTKSCIIATGFAGTSKTYIPTVIACDKLRSGEIKRLYLTRPNISNSKSLGYFSGSHIEKLSLWLLPILTTMYDRLGKNVVDLLIKSGDIQFVPLETIKGMSFGKDTFVICDEAEDLTIQETKSVLTRQGAGTLVMAGDLEQSALRSDSGLAFVKKMVERYPELDEHTGFVDFNRPSDIVRSQVCKAWILAMRKEGV